METKDRKRLGAIIRLAVFLLIVFFISTQMDSLGRLWDDVAEEAESLTQIRSETSLNALEEWQPECNGDDAMLRRMLEQTACASYQDNENGSLRGRGPVPKIATALTSESGYNMGICATAKPTDYGRDAGDMYLRETRALVKLLRGIGQACLKPQRQSWNPQLISGASKSRTFGAALVCRQDKIDPQLMVIR